ncbi:hypothetical protein GCM10010446_20920 [Streptomyces enissocaesilis]|uniref:Uncharacterized protein n=1 Tax=Streptomyces enissocaesilis TaxID=332589 RepID=A0ABP6JM86_9ACTN
MAVASSATAPMRPAAGPAEPCHDPAESSHKAILASLSRSGDGGRTGEPPSREGDRDRGVRRVAQAGVGGQLSGDSTPSTYALATNAVRPCTRQRRASRVRW